MLTIDRLNLVLYEMAMSIGNSLDLRVMLREALTCYLKKLNCSAVGVLELGDDDNGRTALQPIMTIPRSLPQTDAYSSILDTIPCRDGEHFDRFLGTLPFQGRANQEFFELMPLRKFGVAFFVNRHANFDPVIVKALAPLNDKLAAACLACKQKEAVQDSEEQLRTVINASMNSIVAVGPDGRIELCNPAAEAMFGRVREEMLGTFVEGLMPDDARSAIQSYVRSCFEQDRPGGRAGKTLELKAVHSNGRVFPVEASLSTGIRRNRPFVLVVMRDISERKAVEHSMQKAREAAEAANLAKSNFLANMSHEIRTPMTTILGYAETLCDCELDEVEHNRAAGIICRNGRHLLRIIDDILDLSRVESGKMAVECTPCSISAIVEEVTSLMRAQAEAKGLAYDAEYIGALPETIQTDPARLRQILINLVGNAVKFTEAGGVRLVVRFTSDAPSPMIQFDVVDTGIGIASDQADRLFESFSQADASMTRRFGGTGLGLTISRNLARMLGGDVAIVETQPNLGTRFRLTVATGPLDGVRMIENHITMTKECLTNSPAAAARSSSELSGARILLAEDCPDNQRMIAQILRRAGAQVVTADHGQAAVEAATSAKQAGNAFHTILMDMQMPTMDGYQATRFLRERGYTGIIIALTAHAMVYQRDECIEAGCDDYVTKPVDRLDLIELIAGYLCRQAAAAGDGVAAQT